MTLVRRPADSREADTSIVAHSTAVLKTRDKIIWDFVANSSAAIFSEDGLRHRRADPLSPVYAVHREAVCPRR
ncbi:hypothetical protein [Microbacterium elymi]|uniref:Uncharacterized protein n=1 Tax=Microbacterium elymi TaxID=2909587 RepID=A0ABY5NM21_9MICO|nr:hypothetical protein [Microbacterium elymi]UUT36243.1 hypothetical protein L2X98_24900 [Microbacterium elymi]